MSAYRDAPSTAAPSLAIACARCGALAELRKDTETFRCSACAHEQLALRGAADDAPPTFRARTHVEGAYDELVPLARSFGIEARCASVSLDCDGLHGEASVGLSSGSVTGLDLTVYTAGLPSVVLRRETREEVDGKRAGVTHEVQTGDAAFDGFVFVESDHADEDLLPVLAAPAVRAAIVRMLHEAPSMRLSTRYASVHFPKGAGVFDPARIRDRLATLRVIAGAPRAIALRGESQDVWGVAAAAALLGSLFVVPLALAGAWGLWHPATLRPALVGLAAGAVLVLAAQPLLRRKLRGRTDSHRSLLTGRIASALLLPALAIVALVGSNALFDRSPERTFELVVQSVETSSEDKTSTAFARGTGDATAIGAQEVVFDDPGREVAAGQRLTIGLKPGALGWPWRSSPGKVYVGQHVLVER